MDHALVFQYGVYSPDGRCLYLSSSAAAVGNPNAPSAAATPAADSTLTTTSPSLGIRHARWSPSGQLLALGTADGRVQLANNCTWTVLHAVDFQQRLSLTVDVEGEGVEDGDGGENGTRGRRLAVVVVEKSPGDGRGRTQASCTFPYYSSVHF